MSSKVDNRVVEMQFDNKHFESNVKTSLSTIDKLKAALKFDGASKGLNDVNAAAKNCNLSPLGSAVDSVKVKFSALQVMATTALANIANSAVNAGKRLAAAFTIDPIKSGFQEYETQIGAIQTILANTQSKGSTLDDVNTALDELNTYADKTIYNFTEMTRNIGTFTAAGVELDTAVSSIKGIANLAAVSGSTSQQASTAMYQLSQAIAAGKVQLMDWNSVVNAGMGGELFQNALKRTATHLGYNVDAMIEKYGSFRESLTQGEWLTTEVLTETLTQLSGAYTEADLIAQGYTESQAKQITELANTAVGAATEVKTFTQLMDTLKEAAQSGWTQTWEILIGDFEEAKELWSGVSDTFGEMINKSAESRNTLLEESMTSNWDKLVKKVNEAGVGTDEFESKMRSALESNGYQVDTLLKKYGSFEGIFRSGEISTRSLKEAVDSLSVGIEGLSSIKEKLKFGDVGDDVKKVQTALKQLGFDLGKFGVDGIIGDYTESAIKAFQKANDLKVTGIVDEETLAALDAATSKTKELEGSVDSLIDGITELGGRENLLQGFKNIFEGLLSVIKPIGEAFRNIFPPTTAEQVYKFTESFKNLTANFKLSEDSANNLKRTFEGLFAVLDIFKTLAGGALKIVFNTLKGLLGSFNIGILDFTGNIGDALVKLRDWVKAFDPLTKVATAVGSAIGNIIQWVKKWIDAFSKLPTVANAIDKIKNAFTNLKNNLKDLKDFNIKDIFKPENFTKVLNELKTFFSKTFSNIGTIFDQFKLNVSNGWSNFVSKLENSTTVIGTAFGWLKEKVGSVVTFIKDNIGSIAAILLGGALVVGIAKLASTISNVVSLLATPFELIDQIADALTKKFKAEAFEAKANGIKSIAIAIGILAASVTILTFLDQGKVWSAVGAIAALAVVIGVLSAFVSKMKLPDAGKLMAVGVSLLALAASIGILVNSLKVLDGLDPDKLLANTMVLLAITVTMGIIAKSLAKTSTTGSVKGLMGMVGIALAIRILVGALKAIDKLDLEDAYESLMTLLGLVVIMGTLSKLCSGMKFSSGAGMIALAVSLKIMVGVFEDVMELDTTKMKDNIGALIAIVGSVAVLMMASSLAGKHAFQAGVSILAISVALLLLVKVVKNLSEVSADEIKNATDAVSQLLAMFAIIVAASSIAGKHALQAGVMLTMVAGAMVILAGVIHLLKGIDPDGLDNAVKAISTIMGMMALLTASTVFANGKAWKDIVALTAAVTAIAIMIKVLSSIPTSDLAAATAAITGVMVVFGLLIKALNTIDTKKGKFAKTAGTLAVLVVVVAALGAVIAGLSKCDPLSAIGAATALSVLLLALSVSMTLLNKFSKTKPQKMLATVGVMVSVIGALAGIIYLLRDLDPLQAIGSAVALSTLLIALSASVAILNGFSKTKPQKMLATVGALTVVVAALAGILYLLRDLNPAQAISTALSLSAMLLAISGACRILGTINPASAASAAGSLAVFVGIFGALLAALGGLAQIPGLTWLINEGSTLFSAIGKAIGSFVGSIGAGIGTGLTSGLSDMGDDIVEFSKDISEFSDNVSSIDLSGIDTFIEAIAKIAGVQIADKLTGGDGLSDFAAQLAPLARGIIRFSDILSGETIDQAAIENAKNAAVLLGEMAEALPDEPGPLKSLFCDSNMDMDEFGAQLAPFGRAMIRFSKLMSEGDINETALKNAKKAAEILGGMASSLPSEPGLFKSWFVDSTMDMDKFGAQLAPFGRAMVRFSEIVSDGDISQTALNNAKKAAEILGGMASSLPSEPGIFKSWFTDSTMDMDKFGAQLVPFGRAMVRFSDVVGNDSIDTNAIEVAKNAAEILSEMANSLPTEMGAIKSWFYDSPMDMDEFGAKLVPFGRAIVRFSNAIKGGVDTTAVDSVAKVAGIMSDLATNLPTDTGIIKSWFCDSTMDMDEFGSQLVSFGDSIVNFSKSVSGNIDTSSVTTVVDVATKLADVANVLPEDMDLSRISEGLTTLGDAMKEFSESISGQIDLDSVTSVVSAGKTLAEAASIMPDVVEFSKLSNGLITFGESMVELSDTVSGNIDNGAIIGAALAGKNIAVMAKEIPADLDLTNFNEQLGALGGALVSFSESVTGDTLDTEAIDTAVGIGGQIADMVALIPDTMYVEDFIACIGNLGTAIIDFADSFGEDFDAEAITKATEAGMQIANMTALIPDTLYVDDFVDCVAGIGTAIVDFSKNVSEGLDTTAVACATTAGTQIASLVSAIPDAMLVDDFVECVADLGASIIAFSDSVKEGLDATAIDNAVTAGKNIAGMVKQIPDAMLVDDFVECVADLGGAIVGFSDSVKTGIDSEAIGIAVTAGKNIAGMVKEIPDAMLVDDFVACIADLGSAIVGFSTSVSSGINVESVGAAVQAGKDIAGMAKKFNGIDTSSITSTLPAVSTALVNFATDIGSVTMPDITPFIEAFDGLAESSISSLTEGFSNGTSSVVTAVEGVFTGITETASANTSNVAASFSNVCITAIQSIDGYVSSFYSAGSNLVYGFANGITATTFAAQAAAAAMATAALAAAEAALGIESPSKEFYAVGGFAGKGLINALGDYETKVYKAGSGMASSALDGLRSAIGKIKNVVENDIDAQPTIRPVLDLSDVAAGAGRINGMFGMNPSVGVLSNVGTISSMMSKGQNGANDDVISAIRDLKDSISNTPGNTYQINGITYDDGSNVSDAIKTLVRAAKIEGRR